MMTKALLRVAFLIALLLPTHFSQAQKDGFELSGDILEYAIPASVFASTLIWRDDTKPTWQFMKTYGLAAGINYALKPLIDKPRPDGVGGESFPSGHTTSAFAGAAFVERRYGWKAGVPAYLVASYVGWTRVHANRHDWWDVLAGATLGTCSAYLFTKPYKNPKVDVAVSRLEGGLLLSAKMQF